MALRSTLRDFNDRSFARAAARGKGSAPRPDEDPDLLPRAARAGLPFMGAYADAFRPPVNQLAAEVVALRRDIDALRGEVAALRHAADLPVEESTS